MTTVAQTFGYREGRLTEAHSSIALQCGVGIELELEGSDHIVTGKQIGRAHV